MADLRNTLTLVRQKLDEFLGNAVASNEDWVVLSNLVDPAGEPYDGARNRVVMFLANIQNDSTISTHNRTAPIGNDQHAVVSPPIYVVLHVLLIANFYDKNYAEGLEMISRTISFFQQNPSFTSATLPDLDPEIEKLSFKMVSLDMTDLNYVMGLVGAKYLPTVCYKVRLLPFRGEAIQGQTPAARGARVGPELADPPTATR